METISAKEVGANIKRLRLNKGFTLYTLAVCADLDPS